MRRPDRPELWLLWMLLTVPAVVGAEAPVRVAPRDAVQSGDVVAASLDALTRTLSAMAANLEAQEKAWPTRDEDLRDEGMPPVVVQRLQAEHARLYASKQDLEKRLRELAQDHLGPLLEALISTDSTDLLDSLVPVVVDVGRSEDRTLEALLRVARRLEPCPPALVRGLASLGRTEASLWLIDRGERDADPVLLREAVRSGDPTAMEELIDLAEGENPSLGAAALKALSALEPPTGSGRARPEDKILEILRPEEADRTRRVFQQLQAAKRSSQMLEQLVVSRMRRTPILDLKVALVVYLGLFRDADHLGVLVQTYEGHREEAVRLAVVGAVGNLGPAAGEFLLERLESSGSSLDVLRGSIHALGVSRYRPAAPRLIELLKDPELRVDAERALARIAGRVVGDSPAAWIRWWRVEESRSAGGELVLQE